MYSATNNELVKISKTFTAHARENGARAVDFRIPTNGKITLEVLQQAAAEADVGLVVTKEKADPEVGRKAHFHVRYPDKTNSAKGKNYRPDIIPFNEEE